MKTSQKNILSTTGILLIATGVSHAAVVVTVNDSTPTAGQPMASAASIASTYNGSNLLTYVITGVDLTTEGGTSNESIDFTVTVSSTDAGSTFAARGGSGGFAHRSTANSNNFISADGGETNFTYTANLSSTSYTGGTVSLDFTQIFLGNFGPNNNMTADVIDIVSGAGTTNVSGLTTGVTLGAGAGSTVTLNNYQAGSFFGANGYDLNITATEAVPEPSSAILMGLGALAIGMRRKRC